VPAIDVGVMPEGHDGKVTAQLVEITRYSSELPCAFCSECVSTWPISVECMTEVERKQRKDGATEAAKRGEDGTLYWGGDLAQLPTVGYLTTNAGVSRRATQSTGLPERVICLTHDFSLTLDNRSLVSKLSIESGKNHAPAEKLSVMAIRLMQR